MRHAARRAWAVAAQPIGRRSTGAAVLLRRSRPVGGGPGRAAAGAGRAAAGDTLVACGRRCFSSAGGWERARDDTDGFGREEDEQDEAEEQELDPDEFLEALLERQGPRAGSAESFAAMWADGDRDDMDIDWMTAVDRDGIDPEGERVLAVLPFSSYTQPGAMVWPAKMEEALSLCGSLGRWDVVDAMCIRARHGKGQVWGKGPNAKTYLRPGQVKSVAEAVQRTESDVIFIDAILSPMQSRNLASKLGGIKVYDRFGLILEIFAANATTREAKVQVEIAMARYEMTRLVRAGARNTFGDSKQVVSGRQKGGGGGGMQGSGEMQIELERRLLKRKVSKLGKELDKVARHRALQRTGRQRSGSPVVALVGYTNAGKSALINAMTGAAINSQDRLFCTLDTTMRSTRLPTLETDAIVVDTVGFISELPTALVDAFHSTLEEILHADVLLHVRDVSSANFAQQKDSVLSVLREIGVPEADLREKTVEVWNKVDLVDQKDLLEMMHSSAHCEEAALMAVPPHAVVPISATKGRGLDRLISAVEAVYVESQSKGGAPKRLA